MFILDPSLQPGSSPRVPLLIFSRISLHSSSRNTYFTGWFKCAILFERFLSWWHEYLDHLVLSYMRPGYHNSVLRVQMTQRRREKVVWYTVMAYVTLFYVVKLLFWFHDFASYCTYFFMIFHYTEMIRFRLVRHLVRNRLVWRKHIFLCLGT